MLPDGSPKVYTPREWSPAQKLLIHDQIRIHRRVDEGSQVGDWRKLTVLDTSDCSHTSGTMFEVENAHGIWAVVICNDCGQFQSPPQCAHVQNTWHEDGKVLICDNCGSDGT